jgi:hypothetical protein
VVHPVSSAVQSGGVDISGAVGAVDGDVVGANKTTQSSHQSVVFTGDKAGESAVSVLQLQLEERKRELDLLRVKNQELMDHKAGMDAVFGTIARRIIGDYLLSINEYISITCFFIMDKKLQEEFSNFLLNEMPKSGKKNG